MIGAGQAGLAIAARLKQFELDTVVIDREKRVGDNWRNRYQSLLLHNQIWANHLPYLPFPASWPAYLSKDEMADWLEAYAKVLGLEVQLETKIADAAYDEVKGRWTVRLARADGTIAELHPRHIVQATGVFGVPNRPTIRGAERFAGKLIHAEDYEGGIAAPGVRVLVVGAGSSAHDVAQDLCKLGADVTMLQRSSTCVVSVEPGAARAYSIYAEDGPPVEDADFVTNSMPFPLLTEFHKELTKRIADMDRDLLEGLRKAGFALDFGEDDSGFLMKYHRYGGGYYINAGCSDLIVEGKIKIKQGASIDRLERKSVKFSDGTSMDVDVVVVAAGYTNMSESVRRHGRQGRRPRRSHLGLDDEGEARDVAAHRSARLLADGRQSAAVPPYSKYLALQIKADLVGLVSGGMTGRGASASASTGYPSTIEATEGADDEQHRPAPRQALKQDAETYTRRRREIIEAAAQLFKKTATPTRAQRRRGSAESDRATIYYYVASKKELLHEVVRDVVAETPRKPSRSGGAAIPPRQAQELILADARVRHQFSVSVRLYPGRHRVNSHGDAHLFKLGQQYERCLVDIIAEGSRTARS